VRLAYRLAAASEEPLHLVPCVNFGANKIFDNVPAPIAWQKASVKHLRANVFFGPYGEFGLLGVPRSSVHMRLAVAEAIEVPRCRNPSEKDVALLHGHYMKALKDVFERFKAEAPGYQDADLRFDAHLDLVGAEAWAAHRAQMQEEHDPAGLNALFRAKPDSLEAIWTSIFWVVIFSAIFLRALFSEHHIWQSL
jgi:2-acylglycerol O-acyltransferase 2